MVSRWGKSKRRRNMRKNNNNAVRMTKTEDETRAHIRNSYYDELIKHSSKLERREERQSQTRISGQRKWWRKVNDFSFYTFCIHSSPFHTLRTTNRPTEAIIKKIVLYINMSNVYLFFFSACQNDEKETRTIAIKQRKEAKESERQKTSSGSIAENEI